MESEYAEPEDWVSEHVEPTDVEPEYVQKHGDVDEQGKSREW